MHRLALVLILLLAALLRFYRLDAQSLWSDEGNSVSLARAGFAEIAARTAHDIHPPLYYWLLKIWLALFGASEFALRSLSAILAVILVGLIYGLGRRLFGPKVGLAAAFVAALSPFQVYYAQETRMYMLLALLSTLAVWLAVEVWWSDATWPLWPALGYTATVTLGLYTQYAFPIMLVVINLVALVNLWQTRRRLWLWLGLQLIPLLLYLPWLPVAVRQISTWPSLHEAASPATIALTLMQHLALGLSAPAVPSGWLVAMAGLAVLGLVSGWRRWRGDLVRLQGLALVALWLLLPAGLTAALFRPAYLKIFLIASPAFCLLLGLGIVGLSWPWQRRVWPVQRLLPFLAVALLAWPSLLALNAYFHYPTYHRDNYRAIAAFIRAVGTKNDAVIIHAPGQEEVFDYYYRPQPGRSQVHPLPRQRPLNRQQTLADLAQIKDQSDRLYGIFWATEEAESGGAD